ncbi:MAG TPA: hypothetical protein DFR83_15245, partial [Deltaproteobacteria bacterium]|nr:hypothetical protein [Deltaproteobacteria bacterium]
MSLPQVVTVVICVLVLLGTAVGVVGGVARAISVMRALRPGRRLAAELASSSDPAVAFAERWVELDAAFRSVSILGALWAPYAATVEAVVRSDGTTILCSTSAPGDWFRASMLDAGRWSDAAISRLAGLLVSLGILGTFLGLTLGLVEADFGGIQAISSGDARTEALQAAMFGLLAGSGTAFVTSVAGLTGSLVLTAVVRLGAARRVDRDLSETAASMRIGIRIESSDIQLTQQLQRLVEQGDSTAALVPVLERLAETSERRGGDSMPAPAGSGGTEGKPASLPEAALQLAAVVTDLQSAVHGLAPSAPAPEWADRMHSLLESVPVLVERTGAMERVLAEHESRWSDVRDGLAAQERIWRGLELQLEQSMQQERSETPVGADPVGVQSLLEVLEQIEAHLSPGDEVTESGSPPDEASAVEPHAGSDAIQETGRAVHETLAPTLTELGEVAAKFSAASQAFDAATSRLDAAARSNHD